MCCQITLVFVVFYIRCVLVESIEYIFVFVVELIKGLINLFHQKKQYQMNMEVTVLDVSAMDAEDKEIVEGLIIVVVMNDTAAHQQIVSFDCFLVDDAYDRSLVIQSKIEVEY